MKPWMYFVLGGFVGVIGFMLLYFVPINLSKEIARTFIDVPPINIVFVGIWIISGFSSRLAFRWESQLSRLIATILISLIAGVISGIVLIFLAAFILVIISDLSQQF